MENQTLPQPTKTKKAKAKLGAPDAVKSVQTIGTDQSFELISSFRLKRMKAKQTDLKVSYMDDFERFKSLQVLGVKYGVTFCEVLKGLIDRELADVNNGSTLSHWIPALNA